MKRHFTGRYAKRNFALFMLGLHTGFRISEMLSLRISDVLARNGKAVKRITVHRRNMKKKIESRTILLHPKAGAAIKEWLKQLAGMGYLASETFLFQSQAHGNRAISREQAFRIYIDAFIAAGLSGRLGTHSTRKTFAEKMHTAFKGDLFKTRQALGHKNVNNTVEYLSFREEEIDQAILGNG